MDRTSPLGHISTIACAGLLATIPAAVAQPTGAELVASSLIRPVGLMADAQGRVWVAELGTGPQADDGRISVVLPDGQSHPFLVGIPTGEDANFNLVGISHMAVLGDDIWFTASYSATATCVHRFSTAGWAPGDPPRTMDDEVDFFIISTVLFDMGFPASSPQGLAVGQDGALYVADAGANALLRYDPVTDDVTALATFPDIATGGTPAIVEPVPTGLVAADGRFYVATLTGFPFMEGVARVYAVEPNGTFAVAHGGLTALADLARDPRDGALTVVQHGVFSPGPPAEWLPNSGRLIRVNDGRVLADAFDRPSAAAYDPAGVLYVSTLSGDLYRVMSAPVANESSPGSSGIALDVPRPNPSYGRSTVAFELETAADIRLSVHDALGREVRVIVAGRSGAGGRVESLDTSGLAAGAYVARLQVGGRVQTRWFTVGR
jgi:hypothetical protein